MPSVFLRRVWRIARWIVLALALAYIALVAYRMRALHEATISQAMVANIEAQRLTEADMDGTNLPPSPDPRKNDSTLAGIDANDNGIRDDVELAIFAEYPTSSSTSTPVRAAELQYAMGLQMQLTEVFDTATWVAAVQQRNRGFGCLYDVSNTNYAGLESEVNNLVLNTPERTAQFNSIEQYRTSYKLLSGPDCDVRN